MLARNLVIHQNWVVANLRRAIDDRAYEDALLNFGKPEEPTLEFIDKMIASYYDSDLNKNARSLAFGNFSQGKLELADYFRNFRDLIQEMPRMNDFQKVTRFLVGLSNERLKSDLSKIIALRGDTVTLEETIQLAQKYLKMDDAVGVKSMDGRPIHHVGIEEPLPIQNVSSPPVSSGVPAPVLPFMTPPQVPPGVYLPFPPPNFPCAFMSSRD
jgi:hypothetical protein